MKGWLTLERATLRVTASVEDLGKLVFGEACALLLHGFGRCSKRPAREIDLVQSHCGRSVPLLARFGFLEQLLALGLLMISMPPPPVTGALRGLPDRSESEPETGSNFPLLGFVASFFTGVP